MAVVRPMSAIKRNSCFRVGSCKRNGGLMKRNGTDGDFARRLSPPVTQAAYLDAVDLSHTCHTIIGQINDKPVNGHAGVW